MINLFCLKRETIQIELESLGFFVCLVGLFWFCFWCGLNYFYQIFSLFTFQILSLFLVSPPKIPYLLPPPPAPKPSHSHSQSWHSPILGHRTFTGPRASPPLMTNQAILIYIYRQSHMSQNVFSLIGGLVPRSSGGTDQFIWMFFLWGFQPLQLLVYFLQLLH